MIRQDPPWKIVRAFPQSNGGTMVHLLNVSGGVLAGDHLVLDVIVDAGAFAQITTTGATRLYRHRAGAADSEQNTTISVGEGALLEYLPDAVIPYAGSRHNQCTEIHLASGAALFWWEILAPGRQAMGEKFEFERLRVESDIRAGGRPVVRESFLLEPAKRPLDVAARMGKFTHFSTFYVLKTCENASFWRVFESKMRDFVTEIEQKNGGIWGVSTLVSDGVIVRGLSTTGLGLQKSLIELWRKSRRELTGEDAVPPRRVY